MTSLSCSVSPLRFPTAWYRLLPSPLPCPRPSCWWSLAETSRCRTLPGTAAGSCRQFLGGPDGKTPACRCGGCKWTSLWAAWTPSVGSERSGEVSLRTRASAHVRLGGGSLSASPCPVSHQRRSCVGCAAAPGRPSPGVSEPSGLLLATVDLQARTRSVHNSLWALNAVWRCPDTSDFICIREKQCTCGKITRRQKDGGAEQSHLFISELQTTEAFSQVEHGTDQVVTPCTDAGCQKQQRWPGARRAHVTSEAREQCTEPNPSSPSALKN